MEKLNKTTIFRATILALLISLAWSLRYLWEIAPPLDNAASLLRALIYMGIFAAFGISVNRRIIQPQVRFYLLSIAGLILFWMTVRTVRFLFVSEHSNVSHFLWYLYYLPILFIPTFSLFIAVGLGKPESYRTPWTICLLGIPSLLLFGLVLTNDLHQLVFSFPKAIPQASSIPLALHYKRELGYRLIAVWAFALSAGTLFMMMRKCRIKRSKKMLWLPFIPFALIIIYTVLYALDFNFIKTYLSDLTVTMCLLITAVLQACIHVGLIQSNTHYKDLFHVSTIGARITDEDYYTYVSSQGALSLPASVLKQTEISPLLLEGGIRLSGSPIAGGHVIWQEDIRELNETLERLADTNEFLQGENTALAEEYKTKGRLSQLEEQNRLYNLMLYQTREQVESLESLVENFAQVRDKEKESYLLSKITLLGAYIKRRNNLVFLSENREALPVSELGHCLRESMQNLDLFGISCEYEIDFEGEMEFAVLTDLYDVFQKIVEEVLETLSFLFVTITKEKGLPLMIMRLSSQKALPDFDIACLIIEKEGEGEWCLNYKPSREAQP